MGRSAGAILVDWIATSDRRPVPATGWDSLIAEAVSHSVAPQLFEAMKPAAAKGEVPAAAFQCAWMAAIKQKNLAGKAMKALPAILRVLSDAGLDLMVLKGGPLASFIYRDPGERPMRDFDFLARAGDLERAESALAALGYRTDRDLPISAYLEHEHELPPLVSEGMRPIDLHWNIVSPTGPFRVDVDALFARSRILLLDGAPMRVMANEDLLLHVCLHAASDHFGIAGVRPLLDIKELLDRPGAIDWSVVPVRAAEWQAARPAALALLVARDLVGAKVDPNALAALGASSISRPVRAAAVWQVFERPGFRFPVTPLRVIWTLRRSRPSRAPATLAPAKPRVTAIGILGLVVDLTKGSFGSKRRRLWPSMARRSLRGLFLDRWLSPDRLR